MTTDTSKLKQLGEHSPLPASPDVAVLERVPNPHPDCDYLARFTCPEFTSLCPVTGQPDFAHLVIDYVPGGWLVESKSFKLYLIVSEQFVAVLKTRRCFLSVDPAH